MAAGTIGDEVLCRTATQQRRGRGVRSEEEGGWRREEAPCALPARTDGGVGGVEEEARQVVGQELERQSRHTDTTRRRRGGVGEDRVAGEGTAGVAAEECVVWPVLASEAVHWTSSAGSSAPPAARTRWTRPGSSTSPECPTDPPGTPTSPGRRQERERRRGPREKRRGCGVGGMERLQAVDEEGEQRLSGRTTALIKRPDESSHDPRQVMQRSATDSCDGAM